MTVDYQDLIDKAMLGVVKKVLMHTQDAGLQDKQYFYISFRTDCPDVTLSQNVRVKYPQVITIILQHQYNNLQVFENKFLVNIAFDGVKETIEVPFLALTEFIDPSASFSVQFKQVTEDKNDGNNVHEPTDTRIPYKSIKNQSKQRNISKKPSGKVVSLKQFLSKSK